MNGGAMGGPGSAPLPREQRLWADIWQSADGKWCMAVGTHDEAGKKIVLDRKTGMRTERNATTAMEAVWRRWS
jgi:hypothetical protein